MTEQNYTQIYFPSIQDKSLLSIPLSQVEASQWLSKITRGNV